MINKLFHTIIIFIPHKNNLIVEYNLFLFFVTQDPHCSRLARYRDREEIIIADGNDAHAIGVALLEGVGELLNHHTALDKVVQLEAPPLDKVKARHNQLAELWGDAVAHLVVGSVELPGLYAARTVSVVALKERPPLLNVLHQHGKILHANFTSVLVIE